MNRQQARAALRYILTSLPPFAATLATRHTALVFWGMASVVVVLGVALPEASQAIATIAAMQP